MHHARVLIVAATCAALAACAAPKPAAPPPVAAPPPPSPAPAPPPPVVAPSYDNWMDAPATPGDWYYRPNANGSQASFGEGQSEARFAIYCNRSARTIALMRAGAAPGPVAMRIRTETRDRLLTAQPAGDTLPAISVTLAASDPLLPAMAFSKGRFAVETEGMPTLYIPSWPEVTRVIEDCS